MTCGTITKHARFVLCTKCILPLTMGRHLGLTIRLIQLILIVDLVIWRSIMKEHKAFTLIELLIVMAVIVILMGVGLLGGRFAIKRAHKTEHQAILEDLVKATDMFYVDVGCYPSAVCAGILYFDDGVLGSLMPVYESDYFGGPYIDYDVSEHHGAPATFAYVDEYNSAKGAFYFCVENTKDGYVVCAGPGAPEPPAMPTYRQGILRTYNN